MAAPPGATLGARGDATLQSVLSYPYTYYTYLLQLLAKEYWILFFASKLPVFEIDVILIGYDNEAAPGGGPRVHPINITTSVSIY
jgi:hypothetical protein